MLINNDDNDVDDTDDDSDDDDNDDDHRRTGRGGEGGCSPPKVRATQVFWAARGNLGKASFKGLLHVHLIILKT